MVGSSPACTDKSSATDVVAVGTVFREVERLVLENGDEVGEPLHHLLATAGLCVVEVRHVRQFVGIGQRGDDFRVDFVANIGLAFMRHHVLEAGAGRDGDRRIWHAGIFVADVLDEE